MKSIEVTIHTPGFHDKKIGNLVDDYCKQAGRFGIDVHWDFTRTGDNSSLEVKRLRDALPIGYFALDASGVQVSSEEIASVLKGRLENGQPLDFVIGGADGLGQDIVAKAKEVWAFGNITLPHQIARLVLAEQLYRGATIIGGHPYHRA